jgi:hypothetical protein
MGPLHDVSTLGVPDKIRLNARQNLGWQFSDLFKKYLRLNKFKPDSLIRFRHATRGTILLSSIASQKL